MLAGHHHNSLIPKLAMFGRLEDPELFLRLFLQQGRRWASSQLDWLQAFRAAALERLFQIAAT